MAQDDAASMTYPPLAGQMRVDLLTNAEGGVWILHDKPLPDIVKWVDFDAPTGIMAFAYQDGRTQALGLDIPSPAALKIVPFTEITIMLMHDGLVADFSIIPLIINRG